MKKIVVISVIFGVLLPCFSFAQEQKFKQPETVEEVKALGEKALEVGKKELPGVLGAIWEEEILPIWQKMYNWFMTNVWPKIESWFKKEVEPRAKEEIEKRKPVIEEEFQKEKEEMKEELPKIGKSLWEKFKELIR